MHSTFSGQVALSGRKPSMMASVHKFMYDFVTKVIHKSQFSARARGTRRWTALQYTRMFFSSRHTPNSCAEHVLESIIIETLAGYSMGDIILDAEMVAYSDEWRRIEGTSILRMTVASTKLEFVPEFWYTRGLIASTAVGARAGGYRRGETQHDSRTQHVILFMLVTLNSPIFTETLVLHSIRIRQRRPPCISHSFSLMSCRWARPPC
jgi:hypothetical protein